MVDRSSIEALLDELYAARVAGQLDRLCAVFSDDAHFRISGTSDGKPIAVAARGAAEIRSWLAVFVKAFRLADHRILSSIVDGDRAAVHWKAGIHSRITGTAVPTELVDLVQVREGRICSYVEFFVPV